MNPQIKELAEQAEQHAHEQNDKHGIRFKTEYNRKFAELIVTQLVLSLSTNSDGITNAGDFYRYQNTFNKRLGIE